MDRHHDLLQPDDRLDALPGYGGRAGLLAAAHAEPADLRIIVTDRRIRPEPSDAVVVSVGDPAARNVGIVAAHLESAGGTTRAFANLLNSGPEVVHARLRLSTGHETIAERTLDVPAGGAASAVFDLPAGTPTRVQFDLDGGDALDADDDATLERSPFRVAYGTGPNGYPEPYRRAVREGLAAVVGADLIEEVALPAAPGASWIDLFVGESAGAPRAQGTAVLSLRPIPAGGEGRRAAAGRVRSGAFSPEEAPFDATGCDLVYASPAPPAGEDLLFEPLPDRDLSGWRFLPDPLAGTPAPVDHPLWPLFLDGLVARLSGREVAAGWRLRRGTLDPEVTRIGHDAVPFDPARLAAITPEVRTRDHDLRILLIVAGTLCLALLWLPPLAAGRRRLP